jgi:hypothetical protein
MCSVTSISSGLSVRASLALSASACHAWSNNDWDVILLTRFSFGIIYLRRRPPRKGTTAMTTPGLLSTEGLFFLVKGAIKAVSDRPGLTPEQKQTLVEQAWNVIVAYGPIDTQRAMLIGQSLVLNEMLAQAATDAIQGGGLEDARRAARANYASVYRAFHQNQTALAKLQAKAEATVAQKKTAKTEAPAAHADETAPEAEPPAGAPHAPETDLNQIPVAAQPAELSASDASNGIHETPAGAGRDHQASASTVPVSDQLAALDAYDQDIPHAPRHGSPSPRTPNGRAETAEPAEA